MNSRRDGRGVQHETDAGAGITLRLILRAIIAADPSEVPQLYIGTVVGDAKLNLRIRRVLRSIAVGLVAYERLKKLQ
jgi:hypothetical protein